MSDGNEDVKGAPLELEGVRSKDLCQILRRAEGPALLSVSVHCGSKRNAMPCDGSSSSPECSSHGDTASGRNDYTIGLLRVNSTTATQIHRLACRGRVRGGVEMDFAPWWPLAGSAGRLCYPLPPKWAPKRTHLSLGPTPCAASQCPSPLPGWPQGQLIDPRSGIQQQTKARVSPPQPDDQPARTLQHPPRQSDQMIPNRLHPL